MEIAVGSFFGLCLVIWFVQWLRKDHKEAEAEVEGMEAKLAELEGQALLKAQQEADEAVAQYNKSFEVADKILNNESQIMNTPIQGELKTYSDTSSVDGDILVFDGKNASYETFNGNGWEKADSAQQNAMKAKVKELELQLAKMEIAKTEKELKEAEEEAAAEAARKKVKFGAKWGRRLKDI